MIDTKVSLYVDNELCRLTEQVFGYEPGFLNIYNQSEHGDLSKTMCGSGKSFTMSLRPISANNT